MRVLQRMVLATAVTVGVLAGTVSSPASAADTGGEELEFAAKLNQMRAEKGLAPLEFRGALFDLARSWSGRMLAAGGISHNPDLAAQGPAGWVRLGENVGVGYSVQALHDAFVASPLHYKNMVDPAFDAVGVGVVHAGDGGIYVTVNFETTAKAAPAPAPTVKKSTRVCTRNRRGRVVCRRR